MASNSAAADHDSASTNSREDEPLLGRPGDVLQEEGQPWYYNLINGTGVVAQAGIWILTSIVWAGIFMKPLIIFGAHPLLNSAGIFMITQAILVLQPTHTKEQKLQGTQLHAIFNSIGMVLLAGGLVIIEYNKFATHHDHFQGAHGVMGLITYILFFIQATVGMTMFLAPGIYGGIDNAKSIYKYHRMSGYFVLTFALATIAAATQTPFNLLFADGPGLKLWSIVVAAVLIVMGVYPRIKKRKLGF